MSRTFAATHLDDPHRLERSGWLRAAVLGATDGIVSISSLLLGVAAASVGPQVVLATGTAGLVAGAMSMAAGEYVSVSSQSDIERAEIERERRALREDPEGELAELTAIYRGRGLSPETARRVADELTRHDALDAHMRDEVGLSDAQAAGPARAALASGITFTAAGLVPLMAALLAGPAGAVPAIIGATVVALVGLGGAGARAGGAPLAPAMARTAAWGVAAMAVTAGTGWLFGVAVS